MMILNKLIKYSVHFYNYNIIPKLIILHFQHNYLQASSLETLGMRKNQVKVEESDQFDSKGKKGLQQYKCGDQGCGKFYHSYTAFYNHCKKSHNGQFPKNSLFNDKPFQGPTKNRGRPRIKKNQAKDLIQIQSMKKQNELIQFMGTLKTKKSDELIVYVENPVERVQAGVIQVKQWLRKSPLHELPQEDLDYLNYLEQFNRIIDQNDLPQFYDPIQTHLYPDKLDSYSFSNIYNFMMREDMRKKFDIKIQGKQLLFKIYLCWSSRILSQKLFNQVLYIVLQIQHKRLERRDFAQFQRQILDLLYDKKFLLQQLILTFFQYFMKQHQRDSGLKNKINLKSQNKQELQLLKDHKKVHLPQKKFASDGDQDSYSEEVDYRKGNEDSQQEEEDEQQ